MNAKDFMKSLEDDSPYPAMMSEKRRRTADLDSLLSNDEKPLVDEIVKTTGIGINSVWDLANASFSYSEILDALVDHIVRPYHFRTREGIARALTVKEARGTKVPGVLIED